METWLHQGMKHNISCNIGKKENDIATESVGRIEGNLLLSSTHLLSPGWNLQCFKPQSALRVEGDNDFLITQDLQLERTAP